MRKFIPGSLFIIVPVIILLLLSCTVGSCFEETESYLKASFYDNTTKKLLPPDTLTLYGINRDSIIYNQKPKVQPALMPLNSSSQSCIFIIKIKGVADTIEFRYSSYPHFVSKECGYTFYHQLDTALVYSKNFIKGIYISNQTITNLNVENIRIFY